MAKEKRNATSESSHEKHVEAGRKGAEARWSKGSEAKSESSPEKRWQAGDKGSKAEW